MPRLFGRSASHIVVPVRSLLAALSWILWAVLATGCPIVITCADTGCPSGQVCDRESGLCTQTERDCRVRNICRAGEVCDEETGSCRPQRLRCTESFTCPEGQSCNASSGFCEPTFRCQTNADCGVAEECNTTTQQCDPRQCQDDAGCPIAHVCDANTVCRPGCRPGAGGCPPRQFCSVLGDEAIGLCEPNCRADPDCPFGQFCDLTSAPESRCVNEGPCTVDADCRVDEICIDNACGQPPCSSNDDCLESQLCDTTTRACRSAECTEDNFGSMTVPNHARQNAASIDFGAYTQLVLCPGRSDWFALAVRDTDVITIRLAQHIDDVDFDVFVYAANGELIAANQVVAPVSLLKFASERDQVIYIEVRSTTFEGGTYDLSIVQEFCVNDAFEENDTAQEATVVPSAVGVPSEFALRACGFDEDWFRIQQNNPRNGLRVERVSSTTNLRVDVFTPDGRQFLVGGTTPFRALRSGFAGTTYVRAVSRDGQPGDYSLVFEVLDAWSCVGAGEHSSPLDAVQANSANALVETFCPVDGSWEVDWVELAVDQSGILDLVVEPFGDAPPYEVVLWAGDGNDNTLIRTATIVDAAAHLQTAITPDARWFVRISSSGNIGRVLQAPGYRLQYVIR